MFEQVQRCLLKTYASAGLRATMGILFMFSFMDHLLFYPFPLGFDI